MSINEQTNFSQQSNKYKCLVCGIEYLSITDCPVDGTKLIPVEADEFIGRTIEGKYLIIEKLGTGGMSIVYKAKQILMERIVAIKFLINQDTEALKRFKLEAKLASSLSHPNIITLFDFGIAADVGKPFIVMDYLEGLSLIDIIKQKEYLSEAESLRIFFKVIDALAYAHEKSILHRDLKPANIMLCSNLAKDSAAAMDSTRKLKSNSVLIDNKAYEIKLVDFGIAKLFGESENEEAKLTKAGEIFGSPIYMSPEQFLGEKLDNRSDIYSFGVVMYETVSGFLPLVGKNLMETLNKRLSEKPQRFLELDPQLNISPELERIILKCLEKDPNHRYQSMRELEEDIEHLLSNNPSKVSTNNSKLYEEPLDKETPKDNAKDNLPKIEKKNNFENLSKKPILLFSLVAVPILCIVGYLGFTALQNPKVASQKGDTKSSNSPITKKDKAQLDKRFEKLKNDYVYAKTIIDQNKILTKLSNVSQDYENANLINKSIVVEKYALDKYRLKYGVASSDYLSCLEKIKKSYQAIGNSSQANKLNNTIQNINKILQIQDQADKLFEQARLSLADRNVSQARSQANKAIKLYKDCINQIENISDHADLSIATIYNKIGQSFYICSQPSQSLKNNIQAREICELLDSIEAKLELAKANIGIGTSYFGLNNYENAKDSFMQALRIRQKYLGNGNLSNVEILSCLSIVANSENNKSLARDYLKQAIKIQSDFDPNSSQLQTLQKRLSKI